MIEKLGVRAIVIGAIGLMLVLAVLFGLSECSARQTASKRAEVSKEQGSAATHAGADALNTVGNVASNDSATDATVTSGQAAIHDAPQGQKGKVSRKVACGFKSAAGRPECKEK
jgi:hypothetical protein